MSDSRVNRSRRQARKAKVKATQWFKAREIRNQTMGGRS